MVQSLKPDIVYRVTKDNSDGSVFAGDLIYIDKQDKSLVWVNNEGGWLNQEELTSAVMDFECEPALGYYIYRDKWCARIQRKEAVWGKAKGNWITPGGDPLWECPVCHSEKSRHVYGIENMLTGKKDKCPNCYARLSYPRDKSHV